MKKIIVYMLLAVFCLTGCEKKTDYVGEGVVLLEEQKYEEAIQMFQEATKADETDSEAYRGIGMAYLEQGQYEEARTALSKVTESGGEETVTLYHMLGVCAMKLGDFAGAQEAFQKGVDVFITNEAIEKNKKQTEEDTGEDTENYENVVREMRFNQIVCFEKQYDWENAKIKADEFLTNYPNDETVKKEAEFLNTR